MRIADLLAAPFRVTTRSTRWSAFVVFGLLCVCALAAAMALPGAKGQLVALAAYATGAACLWLVWMPLLLAARDGRDLCVPGTAAHSAMAATMYTLASVALPVLVVAATGGNLALAALGPALAVAGTLAWMLLPRWAGLWLAFAPALYIGAHNALDWPSPLDARVQHGAWLVLAILIIVDVVCWRLYLRGALDSDRRWGGIMLTQIRRNTVARDALNVDQQWAFRRPDGARAQLDLRRVDAAHPVKAICVSLGGWYLPQTWRGRLGALGRALLPLLLFIPLLAFMSMGHGETWRKLLPVIGIAGAVWMGLFGAAMLAVVTIAVVSRRWNDGAGMALLALLPGLGGDAAARHAVRAVFSPAIVALVVLWLGAVAMLAWLEPRVDAIVLVTLLLAALAAVMFMVGLRSMAGRPLGRAGALALLVPMLVLSTAGFSLVMVSNVPWASMALLQAGTASAWLVFIVFCAWSALTSWRTLQRRPHPFLANCP